MTTIVLKGLIVLTFIGVAIMLSMVWWYARNRFHDPTALSQHRWWARLAVWTTVIGVLLIETAVQLNKGSWDLVHLLFAVPFLAILIGQQWLTGYKKPVIHKVLGYACFIAFVGTAVTGSALLHKL